MTFVEAPLLRSGTATAITLLPGWTNIDTAHRQLAGSRVDMGSLLQGVWLTPLVLVEVALRRVWRYRTSNDSSP
eukprot:4586168-Amphidinium_carterae.1